MSSLPRGWSSVQLEELGANGEQTVLTGPFGANLGKEDFVSSGVPVFTIGCLGTDQLVRSKLLYISPDKAAELETYRLRSGDFLFSRMASVGRAGIVPTDLEGAIFNYHLMRVRLADEAIQPRLFYYFIRGAEAVESYLKEVSRGATRDGINTKLLLGLPVLLPPFPEQRRIVAKIDSLSSKSKRAREHLDHIPRLVEKYKQAVLTAAFSGALSSAQRSENLKPGDHLLQGATHPLPESWTWKAIGEVASVAGGLTKNAKRSQLPSRRPYLRVANVYANELRLDDVGTIGCTDKEFEKTKLEPGDLLVVEGNGSIDQIGRVAMWLGAVQDCVHQNHLIRVRCHRNLNPSFALYWLLSPGGRKAIEEKASTTTGLHTLSISKVAQLGIPVPDTMEQAEIVKKIEHAVAWIDRLAAEAISARTLIDRLDQAVLAKAFRGELVPQDPNDEPASVLLERIRAEREAVPAAKPRRGRARRS